MKRMWSRTLVVMGALVLGGGLALAQGKGEKPQSPAECEAECKADVKDCQVLCKKRMKVGEAECTRVCNMMAQECVTDCRHGSRKDE